MIPIFKNLEEALNSKEFTNLYNNVSWNNLMLHEIPEAERKLAYYLFLQGKDDSVKGLEYVLYKKKIPTIQDYLDNHLGALGPRIFPQWRKDLLEIFDDQSLVWEVIFSGSIGSGKTSIATIAQMYNLIRVSCLRNPQEVLGVMSNTLLFIMLISITLEKAGMALMNHFIDDLTFCDYFERVKQEEHFQDFKDTDKIPYLYTKGSNEILFPSRIRIIFGSRVAHTLSYALIGAVLDEAEYRISGLSDAVEIYANLKERVRSRFLDKKKLILLTLISSARYEKGIIADMLKSIQKDKSSKDYVRYLAYPIWEVRQFNSYDRGHFYVMRGTKTYPSKILTETEQVSYETGTYSTPVNCKVIKVPEEYRRDFLSNIDLHLRNLAGEQTFGSEFLFDDLTKIEYNDLMPEITVELNLGTGKTILEQLPKSFLTNYNGTLRLSRYPNAPRYVHLDLAETAEAGVGICHKELKDGQYIIVVDLACRVVTRSRIDLEEILVFIRYLKEIAEVKFNAATADRFQSAYILQRFKAEQIADEKDVKILSMDKETAPYRQFSDVVGANLFHIGKCPILKHQMEGVMEEVNENGKPHIIAVDKKDLSDAVGGSVVNALMCTRDVPIYSRDRVAAANIDKLIDPKRIMEL